MSEVFLGIIAVSVLAMAVIQIGALIYAARLARRVEALTNRLEDDLKPVISNVQALTADARKAVALASTQVQRADRMLIEFSARVDKTFTLLQQRILTPAKQVAALMAGMRAALTALRGFRDSPGRRRASTVEEDDALFIG